MYLVFEKVVTQIFDLKNKFESSTYHSFDEGSFSSRQTDTPRSPRLLEISLLKQLSKTPHPNIAKLITSFKANTDEQHELFAQQLNPDNPKKIYATARIADFLIIESPKVCLSEYYNMRTKEFSTNSAVVQETRILSVLSQVLLAIGHLINNQIAHCAICSENVYIDENNSDTVVLSNFSHAAQLNSQKQNLQILRKMQSRLQLDIENSGVKRQCMLSPEVVEAVENSKLENAFLRGELKKIFAKNDTYSAGWMVYSLVLGKSHPFLCKDRIKPYSCKEVPYLRDFSSHLNYLLKNLIAYDHKDRLTPIDGAIACFILLFGPTLSEVKTEDQCYEWLLSETMEFYMRPVLLDSKLRNYKDPISRLLSLYLTIASGNPKKVWDTCKFLSQNV